jgi:putative membrane protein
MMGFGFGTFGLIVMLLFFGVIIALAVWVVGSLFPRGMSASQSRLISRADGSSDSPSEVLKHRYASGEISKAEYEEMSQTLRG